MPRLTLHVLRALRAAPSRGARLAEFLYRRRDADGDIYPHDADHGTVAGPDPDRVLFLGEKGQLSLGVRTHELSLPAFYARRRATATGRGVSWSIAAVGSASLKDAPAEVVARAPHLSGCDDVVLLFGITDALRVVSPSTWETALRQTIDLLIQGLPRGGHVTISEIPPLGNAGSLSAPARLAAGLHGRALNARTRLVAEDYAPVSVVEFPEELTRSVWRPESEEHRYRDTYRVWGEHLAVRTA
jgi:hypothetical protein